MTQNADNETSWENTELVNWLSGTTGWPIDPARTASLEEVADELEYILFLDKEADQNFRDIYESFAHNGGNWRKVDWEELANDCMSDLYGEDWQDDQEDKGEEDE